MSAERLVLWWVDRYTRGLPDGARADRRSEIASDLWEHRSALGTTPKVSPGLVSRCLRGIPADLSWRRSQRRQRVRHLPSRASMARGTGWALGGMGYVLLVIVHAWTAAPLVGIDLYPDDWDPEPIATAARISGVLLALLVSGGLLLRRLPLAGALMIAGTTFATLLVYWWLIPITGPAGVAATIAATILASRRRGSQSV